MRLFVVAKIFMCEVLLQSAQIKGGGLNMCFCPLPKSNENYHLT